MTTKKKWKFHLNALKYQATEVAELQRIKDDPLDDTDFEIVDDNFKITPPIEMLNDEKERHRYGTVASIMLVWCAKPSEYPKERDRLISNGINYRVRKVKAWPQVDEPAFFELHIEDES